MRKGRKNEGGKEGRRKEKERKGKLGILESSNLGIGRLEADRGKKEQIFSQNKRTQDDKRANITGKGRQKKK